MGVSQPKPFVYKSPAENRLLLARRERWIFNNRVMIWILLIHWLGPPLFLLSCSEATLAIWNEKFADSLYRKYTPPAVRLEPAIIGMQMQAFLPI